MGPTREQLAEQLLAVMEHLETLPGPAWTYRGNAPGHGHTTPGVWDTSNRPGIAGRPCEWCKLWEALLASRAAILAERAGQKAPPAAMRRPTITEVRHVVEAHRARQGIVLLIGGGKVAGASYGATKAECGRVGKTLDEIVDGITAGRLPCP